MTNKPRSVRSTADNSVTPTSTENMSTEMTTLSAGDVGISRLEQFKTQTENLGMATNSLFNALRTSEESTRYLASLSNYPSIGNAVRENVKNCTHMQGTFQSIFDLVYSYERRMTPVRDYVYGRYQGQRSLVQNALDIEQLLWSLMLDISGFVIPVPVTDAPAPRVEFTIVMETLATLSVQCEIMTRIFEDLKQCSTI